MLQLFKLRSYKKPIAPYWCVTLNWIIHALNCQRTERMLARMPFGLLKKLRLLTLDRAADYLPRYYQFQVPVCLDFDMDVSLPLLDRKIYMP